MVFWPGVRAERWATVPAGVARVTRCIRSSSWRRLRQVSPVVFSATRMSSSASQQSWTWARMRSFRDRAPTPTCEHCPNFCTDSGYLAVLGAQRADTLALAADAKARGWGAEATRHRQLADRLDQLMTSTNTAKP